MLEYLDIEDLVQEVKKHEDGIDATILTKIFSEKGYSRYAPQRALQLALDKGILGLGEKLRIVLAK